MVLRGRGRGGRGRGGGFLERSSKKEPYILFLEDVILPSLPNIDSMTNEEKLLIRSKYKLEHFWLGLCYHLELEAFSKSEKLKNGKEKSSKVPELSAKRAWRATKKLRWDRDLGEQKLDVFAKLEEKYKGNDGEEAKKDESEDEIEPEEGGEYSDEGDYEQNRDFDDDDDMNMDDGRGKQMMGERRTMMSTSKTRRYSARVGIHILHRLLVDSISLHKWRCFELMPQGTKSNFWINRSNDLKMKNTAPNINQFTTILEQIACTSRKSL